MNSLENMIIYVEKSLTLELYYELGNNDFYLVSVLLIWKHNYLFENVSNIIRT